MSWLIDTWHYLWVVFGNIWGIVLLITGALDLWERLFDRKTTIPAWLRISVFVGVVFIAQGVAYKDLVSNPPTILHVSAPPAPIIQVTDTLKPTARADPEQNQSGHDNVQGGAITQAPCSAVQQGGSGNQANINCVPPPLQLVWSAKPMSEGGTLAYNQIVTIKANVDFHPVSLAILCDQEIKAVNVYGVFFGSKSWGVAQQSAKVGLVYFDNPSLAAGVPLEVVVSSDRSFKVVDVKPIRISN